jgi:hypothetical protein
MRPAHVGARSKCHAFASLKCHSPEIFRGVRGVTIRLMSDRELGRLEALRDLDQRRLTAAAAARLLARSERQVFRLLKASQLLRFADPRTRMATMMGMAAPAPANFLYRAPD